MTRFKTRPCLTLTGDGHSMSSWFGRLSSGFVSAFLFPRPMSPCFCARRPRNYAKQQRIADIVLPLKKLIGLSGRWVSWNQTLSFVQCLAINLWSVCPWDMLAAFSPLDARANVSTSVSFLCRASRCALSFLWSFRIGIWEQPWFQPLAGRSQFSRNVGGYDYWHQLESSVSLSSTYALSFCFHIDHLLNKKTGGIDNICTCFNDTGRALASRMHPSLNFVSLLQSQERH